MRFLLVLILLGCVSFISNGKEIRVPIWLEKSEFDSTLTENESIYTFTFDGFLDSKTNRKVHYSIDGKSEIKRLRNNVSLDIKTTPGNHKFQFFYSEQYFEVYSDSLKIKPNYHDYYNVYLEDAINPVEVEKPVIYLYPKETQEVRVYIDIIGREKFIYPPFNLFEIKQEKYSNSMHIGSTTSKRLNRMNKGWRCIANPDGTINLDNKDYNYLFWESERYYTIHPGDQRHGFVIKGEEATSFLEEKLTEAGLNSKEKADFITYWAPRLSQNEHTFIQFLFNDRADDFAKLNIEPKPDNLYRIYMIWAEVDKKYTAEEQKIIPINRSGFTAVEWGGFELHLETDVQR